jgi:hypothetical protein
MTAPRNEMFDPCESGFYHCISRCVRRAFLCGNDPYTGKSFEHRKKWVENKLFELLEIFAMDCFAYSVMSSHLHTLLRNLPELAASWSNEEVARRWCKLFPRGKSKDAPQLASSEARIRFIASTPALVDMYRERLSDISWFQRCLNEFIACKANAEDKCTGRFWEGRFKSVKLETEGAILSCAAYIDLNPIRAKSAATLEECNFTSIQDRILNATQKSKGSRLASFSTHVAEDITDERYLQIVEETGKIIIAGKGRISDELQPILLRLGIKPDGWLKSTRAQENLFRRVIGSVDSIRALASRKSKKWFQGLAAAAMVFA